MTSIIGVSYRLRGDRAAQQAIEPAKPMGFMQRDKFTRTARSVRDALSPWVRPCVEGAAVTAVTGLGASRTLTPSLLALRAPMDGSLLHIVPGAGPALSAVVGSSIFGSAASACLLATSIGTLTAARDSTGVRTAWALAHASLGFALSPLLVPGVAAAAMPVTLLLGSAIGLSIVLTDRLISGRSSWAGAIAGITLTLAVAPVAAQLVLTQGGALASAHILKILASGSILASVYRFYGSWPRFVANETAYLERFLVSATDVRRARLDLPGNAEPNVFGANQDILELVSWCKLARRYREPYGMVKVLLQGPAGSGKTELARGIASELDAYLAVVDAPRLCAPGGSVSPASNVLEVFSQARELRKATGRDVVIFFDEIDSFAPDRDHMDATTAETRDRNQLVNVLLQCLDGAHKPVDESLVVLAATNYPERLDSAIRQRFLLGAQLFAPGRAQLRSMLKAHLSRALNESPLRHHYRGVAADASLIEQVVDHALGERWVGRQVSGFVARVSTGLAVLDPGRPRVSLRTAVEGALRPGLRSVLSA